MAKGEVTGKSKSGLDELRQQYRESPKFLNKDIPFQTAYCLTRIGKQPDEYDGPTRYCVNRVKRPDDGSHAPSCNFHGGTNANDKRLENLDPTHRIEHGMYATDEHLEEVFTEEDQKLYDYVMSWADTYGWPSKEEDPSRYDDLHAIAMAKVRNVRANKYILDEGELKREEIYDENGNLRVVDNPHGLSEDVRLKRKLITDIKKELGITPKSRSQMDVNETEASAAEQLADVASEAVLGGSGDDAKEFDPDDEVFEDE